MKRTFALLALLGASLSAYSAPTHLIARLVDGRQAKVIANDYQVDKLDQTVGATFVLYGVDDSRHEAVQAAMNADPRIVWAEDDLPLGSPEGVDQLPEDIRGRVGGTIPAIFDVGAGLEFNDGYIEQIGYVATPFVAGHRTVRVAILDTGLSPHQPKLWDNVVAVYDATGQGTVYDVPYGVDTNQNGVPDEGVGHGTFVTSIVATLAPHAKLVVVRAADSDGIATSWRLIKGVAFAVSQSCELANISLGSVDAPPALGDVIEWAEGFGLLVVAGAGNDNVDRALYPARFSHVVGVAGIDPKDRKADFSNYDGHILQSAPSVLVAGAWWKGGMMGWSGTSFASPFVVGCLADTARIRPVWTPQQVQDMCEVVGTNIDPINPSYEGELGLRLNWALLYGAQGGSLKRPAGDNGGSRKKVGRRAMIGGQESYKKLG